ncbi:hypothetical protein WJX82_011174 [Trebouxia sp. C0006]
MAHFVGPLTALEAEELLLKLAPTLRYPELVDLATICGYAPLMLSVVAGAVKKQKLSTQDVLLAVRLKGALLKAFAPEFAAARKVAMGMLAQAADEQLHVVILLTLFQESFSLEAAAEVIPKDSRLLQGQLQDRLPGHKVFQEARHRYVQYFAHTLLQQATEMYVLSPQAAIYMIAQDRPNMLQLLSWMKDVTLPVSTLVLTAGLSANFGEVLTAASLPYRLLLAAASSCLQSLPALTDAKVRITAMHSLAWAKQVPWPGHWEISPAQKALEEKRLLARRGIDSVMDEVYAVLKPIRSAVDKAKVASVGMIKQDLAEHEEKHGMDHPSIARLAWKLGKCLEGNDREAMLIRAATALIECPGTAHEMTYMCLSDLCSVSRQTLQAMAAGLVAGTTYWWNKTDEGFVDNPMLSEVLMAALLGRDVASRVTRPVADSEEEVRITSEDNGQGDPEYQANLLALRSCSASSVRLLRHQPASKAFQISEHGHYHHWTAQLISGHAVATCPSPLLNGPLQQCRLNDQPCKETPSLLSNDTKVVLYKGRYMQTFRLLVRFKIFQLVGIAALAIPINTFLMEGSVSGIQMVMASSLILGCGFASTTLWWFSQRYIGELSLMGPHLLRFSVLDFWGNRQDSIVPVERVVPPLKYCTKEELHSLAEQPMIPLNVEGDRQYLISLRHGLLVDKQRLFQILEGTFGTDSDRV